MKNLNVVLGRRIREIRQAKGLTIQELADLVNLDPSFLGQIERGVGVPSLDSVNRIAQALHVPFADFFQEPASGQNMDVYVREASQLLQRRSKQERLRALTILKQVFPRQN